MSKLSWQQRAAEAASTFRPSSAQAEHLLTRPAKEHP